MKIPNIIQAQKYFKGAKEWTKTFVEALEDDVLAIAEIEDIEERREKAVQTMENVRRIMKRFL